MSTISYIHQAEEILDASLFQLSNLAPPEWAEKYRILSGGESAVEGPFSWRNSYYMKEPLEFFSPYHPGHTMAVMKASQIAFSKAVLENAVGYRIKEHPCNILYLVGHNELLESTMNKIDRMIDSCGIRPLIHSNVKRAKSNKSGDTDLIKQFPNGYLKLGITNYKSLRGESYMVIIVDDFEAMKGSTKQAGAASTVIEQRAAGFSQKRKICYASSPELKQTSNIEPVYLLGDQRRYFIECPHCKQPITFEWSIDLTPEAKDSTIAKENSLTKGGITWKLNDNNRLIIDSVGYTCQKCARFFNDRNKDSLVRAGKWIPTAQPSQEGYYSYQISALYAPSYMYGWADYINKYLVACPPDAPVNEPLLQGHYNHCLGLPYEPQGEAPKANQLQQNIRGYQIGTVPDSLSMRDGNGQIVLLTCACDLNGTEQDARVDYEIVGWSKSGASYSISQGSVGTFVPREGAKKHKEDRAHWTYEHNRPNSVWPELLKVINADYFTDAHKDDPKFRRMRIGMTAIDTGHYTEYAYPFIDAHKNIIGLKGKDRERYVLLERDVPTFRPSIERAKLYLINVNQVKDQLAGYIKLRWDKDNDDEQPVNFMNYPTPSEGKYLFTSFFSHYEAEHRVVKEANNGKPGYMIWEKIDTNRQNHFWDVRVYNIAVRDIIVWQIMKELKNPKATWSDFVALITKQQ